MKRKVFGIVVLMALAAMFLFAAAACSGKTSYISAAGDFAYLMDPGSGADGSGTLSPVKEGEKRTYDVILHNGYDRDTLEIFVDGTKTSYMPAAGYDENAVVSSGYQVAGSVEITGTGKEIAVTFACEGKEIEIAFTAAEGSAFDADDPTLALFTINDFPLADYVAGGKKLTLNYVDIKDSFTFEMKGPTLGMYSFQSNVNNDSYRFMTDGEREAGPVGSGSDLNGYSVFIFPEELHTTGKTITVDPRGLYLNDWYVWNESGSILTPSITDSFPADEGKSITLTVRENAQVNLQNAVLYVNDTAVPMTGGSYTFDTAERSPISFCDKERLFGHGESVYRVRLEGAVIDMGEGTGFAKTEFSSSNPVISAERAEQSLPIEEGVYVYYGAEPYYIEGNTWYFEVFEQTVNVAVCINFSSALESGVQYRLGVTSSYNGQTLQGEFDLQKQTFLPTEYAYQEYFAELSEGALTLYAVINSSAAENPSVTDESCFQVTLCFTLAAGSEVTGTFD